MIKYIENRLALSNEGVHDFLKAVFWSILFNLALMLPAVYVYVFLKEYLEKSLLLSGDVSKGFWHFIFLGLLFFLFTWIVARIQYRSTYTKIYRESANRRISLAEKLRCLPLAFFNEKNLSDLTSTIMSDNTELEKIFSHAVPQLFASLGSILLLGTGLFLFNWKLALALFWVVPFAGFIILFSKRTQHRNFKSCYDAKRCVSEHIQEGLDIIQEIKSYGNEEKYSAKLKEHLNNYERELTKGELVTGVLVNSAQSFLKLGLASVIIVGAKLLATGETNLFTYLIFLLVASRIYDPINEVFNHMAVLFFLDIRINRMNEMMNLPVQSGSDEFKPDNFGLTFENVCFSYKGGERVINGVSFEAKQGEITALAGPSGGGKSTIAKLVARFWDIDSGRILLGNHDISKIDPEILLQSYSIVFQDVVLFNASIMDNIRIGKRNATDEEVLRAARLAQCDDFVNEMPEGYQTIIGENGQTLSGGERQRISIARALLKDAPIVLLDEATASLDVENETKIQDGISALIKNKTVLIIAHRIRTIANAHKIVVLKNGQIEEMGSPDELKKQKRTFYRMLRAQIQSV